jgi:hypothetical protein
MNSGDLDPFDAGAQINPCVELPYCLRENTSRTASATKRKERAARLESHAARVLDLRSEICDRRGE